MRAFGKVGPAEYRNDGREGDRNETMGKKERGMRVEKGRKGGFLRAEREGRRRGK